MELKILVTPKKVIDLTFRLMARRLLIIFTIFLAGSQLCSGTHIIGGNIVFEHISNDDYRLGIKVLVDCENGQPNAWYEENGLYIGMYSKNSDVIVDSFRVFLQAGRGEPLEIVRKECVEQVDFCMLELFYFDTVTMDPAKYSNPSGYYFSWERCCRNNTILNIIDPETNGVAFYAEVPNLTIRNSLPRFDNLPLSLLCVNNFFAYDFRVIDADGDSLVLSLTEPLKGNLDQGRPNSNGSLGWPVLEPRPYPKITWNGNFGLGNIMNGNPPLTINPETGLASVTPTQSGVFVFAIKVDEYRNGVKIGEVIRELQYTVSKCSKNAPPSASVAFKDSIFYVYPGQLLSLNFDISDEDGDSVFAEGAGVIFRSDLVGDPKATLRFNRENGKLNVNISWKPSCDQISSEPYTSTITVRDNGCPLPSQSLFNFQVKVDTPPTLERPDVFCAERISDDSLQINLGIKKSPEYFAGVILELLTDTGWTVLDTIDSPLRQGYRLFAPDNREVTYCYRAYSIDVCGNAGELTDSFCSTIDIDVPPPVTQVNHLTVVDDQFIALNWKQNQASDFGEYLLSRSKGDEDFMLIKTFENIDDTFFIDSTAMVDSSQYHYYLQVQDDCEDLSPLSPIASSIFLSGAVLPYVDSLFWTEFDVWPVGEYVVLGESEPNAMVLDEKLSPTTEFFAHELEGTDDGLWAYRVEARHESDTLISQSNSVEMMQNPVVWIPNAYTPNEDGLNELWDINADFIGDFFLQVYNRWGSLVFESFSPNNLWNGEGAIGGVYLYKVTYTNIKGQINFTSGSIHILR